MSNVIKLPSQRQRGPDRWLRYCPCGSRRFKLISFDEEIWELECAECESPIQNVIVEVATP